MKPERLAEAEGWVSELRMALVEGPCSRQLRAINELFRIVREEHREEGAGNNHPPAPKASPPPSECHGVPCRMREEQEGAAPVSRLDGYAVDDGDQVMMF